jgi:hypothetical protein
MWIISSHVYLAARQVQRIYAWLALPATVPSRTEPMPLIPIATILCPYFILAKISGNITSCGVMMVYESRDLLL